MLPAERAENCIVCLYPTCDILGYISHKINVKYTKFVWEHKVLFDGEVAVATVHLPSYVPGSDLHVLPL